MKNKTTKIILVGILAVCLILFVSAKFINNKNAQNNLQSQCYTDLKPQKYFFASPNPYEVRPNGIMFYIDNHEFEILQGSDTGSMRPCMGDNFYYIMIKPRAPDEINVGDLVSITRQGKKDLLHRVIRIENEIYTTKGDNNAVEDEELWTYEDINGKIVGVLW